MHKSKIATSNIAKENEEVIFDEQTKAYIIKQDINKAVYTYMEDYGKEVILNRAIPDLRDGMKPSHRYFIWECYLKGLGPKAKHQKLAKLAGATLSFHPHTPDSIEGAAVILSQDWIKNVPLVDIHGNNGSIDGSSAAASRYIKARYTKYADLVIGNLDKLKDSILIPSYDNTDVIPKYYPSKMPIILMNNQSGIALGMSTDILPQNPAEMIDCSIAILENKTKEEVRKLYNGPAFVSGGLIIKNKKQIDKLFNEGKGKFKIQSTYKIDNKNNAIYITSLPINVTTKKAIESITYLAEKLPDIEEIIDQTTDNHNVNIKICCKRLNEEKLHDLAHTIIAKSACTANLSANHIIIAEGEPQLLGIYDTLDKWVKFRIETKMKELAFDLASLDKDLIKISYKLDILKHKNELLDLVKNENSLKNANKVLGYDELPEELAKLIKATTLSFLTKDNEEEQINLQNNYTNKKEKYDKLLKISKSKTLIKNEIINELKEIKTILPKTTSKLINESMKVEVKAKKKVPTLSVIAEGMSLVNSSRGDTIDDTNHLYVFLKSGALLKYNSIKLNSLNLMNTPLNRVINKLKANDRILYCCSDKTLPDAIIVCSKEGRAKRIEKKTLQKLRDLSTASAVRQYHKEEIEYFTTDNTLTYKIGHNKYELYDFVLERSDSLNSAGRLARKKVKK